ncbi:DUF2345 domain-containing protein [Acinetobacter pittii]|uniref:DUF2345 domain-containing protein n=1 Tax=Acinetobacter pittii TaxID=48296 RepID=UPI003AF6A5BA
MLFNIFNVLEKIGLSAQKRAVHVQFSNELLNSQVFLQRIEGQHQLNGGLEAELICLSTSAQIALKQFIGVQVAVDQVTDSGQLFRTTGIVTEASYGQSDGALTLYKLTLKDATNLWHKRRNSRVFMNKSIIEVTEVLFKEWQERSPLFATSLSLDLSGLSQSYDIRPFIMQHNESDYDFLTRLWRSEGVSWVIDEAQRSPTKFDVKGQLPDTKKLSGIRSQEISGSGFNQLRFDDTTGQISTQLQSSHAATQLNLGNLSHPKEQATSQGRGEGFELRTDAWGAVRAGKGMLISTYAQEQAIADHLEAAQAQSLLSQGYESMKMLSEVAAKQQTDALNVINRLPKFIQSLELKTTGQALDSTVNLFKEGINNDPIHALKDCGGFIQDIGALGGNAKGVVDEFNSFFSDVKDAVENLKAFIENVEEHGADIVKGKLASIKDRIHKNPFESIQEVGKVLANVETKDFDMMSVCGTFSKGSKLEVSPSKALSSLQGFMEGYTQGLESSSDTKQQEQGKIFRQVLMLLASPNGIALTTPENIILQASQDIAESASGSINLSAQKNIIGHAQDKISLFAAQKGLRAYAAKGKLELQAQDDAIEAIAKKVIKLISTEEKIELTSPKEIVLTAGGSQLKINADGVFSTTGGKFESKAGQHLFTSGATVNAELPKMPESGIFSRRFDFSDIFNLENLKEEIRFKVINKTKNTEYIGMLDEMGRTPRIFSDSSDTIEIQFISNNDNKSIIPMKELNGDIYNYDTGDLIDDGTQSQLAETLVDEYKDGLEDDFNKFGV